MSTANRDAGPGRSRLCVMLQGGHECQFSPVAVPNVSGAMDIGSDGLTTCVALRDGSVQCWGDDLSGQVDGPVLKPTTVASAGPASKISLGFGSACALQFSPAWLEANYPATPAWTVSRCLRGPSTICGAVVGLLLLGPVRIREMRRFPPSKPPPSGIEFRISALLRVFHGFSGFRRHSGPISIGMRLNREAQGCKRLRLPIRTLGSCHQRAPTGSPGRLCLLGLGRGNVATPCIFTGRPLRQERHSEAWAAWCAASGRRRDRHQIAAGDFEDPGCDGRALRAFDGFPLQDWHVSIISSHQSCRNVVAADAQA